MKLDRRMIAGLYGFRHGDCTYFYLSGFDLEFAKFSPGQVLLAHAIRCAAEEGCAIFDFLSGQEPYKYRWGARDGDIYRLTFDRTLLSGNV